MPWWKNNETEPFCRWLSTPDQRVPCQKHECLSYVQITQGEESRFVCRDEVGTIHAEEGLAYSRAIFQDQERIMKFHRGMTRTQLTGTVDDELLTIAHIDRQKIKNG